MWTAGDNCPTPKLSRYKIRQVMQRKDDPNVNMEATERIVKVLDSKYKKSNLEDIDQ